LRWVSPPTPISPRPRPRHFNSPSPVWCVRCWKPVGVSIGSPAILWICPPPPWKPWESGANPWGIWVAPPSSAKSVKPSWSLPWWQIAEWASSRPGSSPPSSSSPPTPCHLHITSICAYAHFQLYASAQKYINLFPYKILDEDWDGGLMQNENKHPFMKRNW